MLTKTISRILLVTVLFAALAAPAAAKERIIIRVEVVYASYQPRSTDRSLVALKSQLESTFSFNSYILLERRDIELLKGRPSNTSIPAGKYLSIRLQEIKGGRARLTVKISDPEQVILSTMFTMSRGQTVLLGGPKYKDGSLIIAIKAGF